ncbi:general secretion pathway protein GspK [bacterium]|nr:general secretion pathway protein GspK [bacterium]
MEKNKGVILVIVLAFTLAITTIVLFFYASGKKFMDDFTNSYKYFKIEKFAELGQEIGEKILKNKSTSYTWIGEDWAGEKIYRIDNVEIKVNIYDEGGKINVNEIIGERGKINTRLLSVFKTFFTVMGYPSSLPDALLDWIDIDDISKPSGAESFFYRNSEYPYVPPNRPLYTVEEISLIKDFSEEVVYGNEEKEIPGLIDFITIFSDGKINVNTCKGQILKAMGYGEADVERIINERDRRPLTESFLLMVNREATLRNRRIMSYKSDYFSIITEAKTDEGEKIKIRCYYLLKDKKIKLIREEYL